MCATCHEKTDPDFPTELKLGAKCKDCHAAVENVPAEWRIEGSPPVRIGSVIVGGGSEQVSQKVEQGLKWMLEKRGFTVADDIAVVCATIEVAIEVFRVRETRFVQSGEQVMQANVTVELKAGGSGTLLLRKRAVSRPEFSVDPGEAASKAAREGLALLAAPIAEALKKAHEASGWNKK